MSANLNLVCITVCIGFRTTLDRTSFILHFESLIN